MRIVTPALIVTAGVAGLVGSALAADMTGAEIKAFVRQDGLSGDHCRFLNRKGGSGSDLLGRGRHRPLQDSNGRHVAWQMGNQRQYAVPQTA
jgi:hypothetical protein